MATVAKVHGSTPSSPGQKLYLALDGTCIGSVGGGAVEREVLCRLQRMLEGGDADAEVVEYALGAELGMCCGGRVEVFVERMIAPPEVLIVGAGHVGLATVRVLKTLGYRITVVDSREAWSERAEGESVRVIYGEPSEARAHLTAQTAVLVMTHDHGLDQDAIEWALREGFPFVGGIGSRAKAARTRQRLVAKGFAEAEIARVRMPLGLAIGARSPAEIAVAVAAELIQCLAAKIPE
jgi:xanthine dehydrogenase accessory factor